MTSVRVAAISGFLLGCAAGMHWDWLPSVLGLLIGF
jgi:hypothetical protein